jgi:hypothetical protein
MSGIACRSFHFQPVFIQTLGDQAIMMYHPDAEVTSMNQMEIKEDEQEDFFGRRLLSWASVRNLATEDES